MPVTALPAAERLDNYSVALSVVGAQGPFPPGGWEVDQFGGPLPTGLLLNTTTGVISGIPTVAGTYPFTIIVQDAIGTTCSKDYSIRIKPILFEFGTWVTQAFQVSDVGSTFSASASGPNFALDADSGNTGFAAQASVVARQDGLGGSTVLSYDNTGGLAIPCQLVFSTSGSGLVSAPNTKLQFNRVLPSAVAYKNVTGSPYASDTVLFTLAAGVINTFTFYASGYVQSVGLFPNVVRGIVKVSGHFSII